MNSPEKMVEPGSGVRWTDVSVAIDAVLLGAGEVEDKGARLYNSQKFVVA